MAAVRVGKDSWDSWDSWVSWISIEFAGRTEDGRLRFRYFIDTPTFDYECSDLKSGVGARACAASLQDGMESLLSFLGAAADEYRSLLRKDPEEMNDRDSSFPPHVMEWAFHNEEEIEILALELKEKKNLLVD